MFAFSQKFSAIPLADPEKWDTLVSILKFVLGGTTTRRHYRGGGL
jgi:hypothetical protein